MKTTRGLLKMKTEAIPYQRIGRIMSGFGNLGNKKALNAIFTRNNLLLVFTAFLMGRASILGGIMPFGVAVYVSTYGMNIHRLLIAAFVILGMVTGGAREQIYIAIAGMILFNAFNTPFKDSKPKTNFRYAAIGFVSVLVPQMIMIYLQGFLLYDLLRAMLYCFTVFVMLFIMRNSMPLLAGISKRHVLASEEVISVAIVAALALSGLEGIQIVGFAIKNILSILIILTLAYRCGAGVGSAIGVTVGLIVSLSSTVTPLIISSFALCGLFAGLFKDLGKIGSSLGFVMGNTVLTLYLNNSSEALVHLKEVIIAVVLFMIIPQRVIDVAAGVLSKSAGGFVDKRSYSLRIKELTVDKLNKFSHAFKELSRTFSEISQTSVVTDKQDISSMFDRVADRVCKDCSLCLHCWDRNFYNTYQVMFKIVEKLDLKGRVEEKDIPDYFVDRCERLSEFVDAVNNMYEVFKVDMVWKNKIGESRGLVSQQLDGLSKVISGLANEIDVDVHFKAEIEDAIVLQLNNSGIKASDAVVFENRLGKYEVSVFHKGCGGKRACITEIEKIVSGVVGRKVVKENNECYHKGKNSGCALRLVEEEAFAVTVGVAKLPKHEGKVSGDNYSFVSNGGGKYIIALSDGMGSGQKASTQSRATITLLEQFMESGFDKDTAVNFINSILILKSSDESFSTIDLSVIDLFDGEVEFVKIGAAPTFIKESAKVESIRSTTLPAGILSNIEMELVHKKVENGDFIIMTSDGVFDAFKGSENNERALVKFLQDIESANPQHIADSILNEAYEICNGKPGDDMTVLVAKIWKRAA
jgi:stage II sporulation protein E